MKKLLLFLIISVVCISNIVYATTLPLYFKSYQSNRVLNNNILDGQDKSLLSENDELVFTFKNTEPFVLSGPISLDLYVEFDVRDVGIEVFIYKLDSNGDEILLEICNSVVRIKQNEKVNRVFIKTCPLEQVFEANENLLVKIRQTALGKIFNLTKLHHSPKYPSKILINLDSM